MFQCNRASERSERYRQRCRFLAAWRSVIRQLIEIAKGQRAKWIHGCWAFGITKPAFGPTEVSRKIETIILRKQA